MSEEVNKFPKAAAAPAAELPRDQVLGADRKVQKRRRKVSYLTINKIDRVDFKDIAILRKFMNDRGKIQPSRQTGTTAYQQRMISRAIHRAREMALLPFAIQEMGLDRKESNYKRERREYVPRERHDESSAPAQGENAAE